VRALLHADPSIAREAHGLAIFSSAEAGVLEAVRLPSAVEPMAVVDTAPWLEPLAEMITPENWGVAVIGRTVARLFRGGARALSEFVTVDPRLEEHARGDPRASSDHATDGQVAAHVRRVAERLARAHRRRAFAHLLITGPPGLRAVVESSLDDRLKDVQVGIITVDLEHASSAQIARVVAPIIEGVERASERALIVELEDLLDAGESAVAGLDDVFSMLARSRVEVLLIAHGASFTAGLCPRCGRLWASSARCPLDGAGLASVDAIKHAAGRAATQAAEVAVVRHEVSALAEHGSIAALLMRSNGHVTPSEGPVHVL
jgi:hypothetical protein